jgi:hypothetical protein
MKKKKLLIDPSATDEIKARSEKRNENRLVIANEKDEKLLGKYPPTPTNISPPRLDYYLPDDPSRFSPPPVRGPEDAFDPPHWLIGTIRSIAKSKCPTPTSPPFRFELSAEAAASNGRLLSANDFDLGKVIENNTGTTLGYGSEFRPISQLESLLGKHPNFETLRKVIENGMPYLYKNEIDEEDRKKEVEAILQRGNHKSATEEHIKVRDLISKEVSHGFAIPIPLDVVLKIPGAMVQALGLVEQWTINEKGERVVKYRLTQDLSYATTDKNLAVNKRIDLDAYPEMIYGWCLPRIIHSIVSLRLAYPQSIILATKYDYSDAYRRIAHSAIAAAQTIGTVEDHQANLRLAFLCLRLTFGGSPNPPTWCMFSEMVTDLTNEILQCDDWDFTELINPDQPVVPEPILLPADLEIAQAIPMAVHVPPIPEGRADVFIDDVVCIFLDTPRNRLRSPQAGPLAMHVTSRPHAGKEEPILRRRIMAMHKLVAEGTPSETPIILGWSFNLRILVISLPDDKFDPWTQAVLKFITTRKCIQGDLETMEGRLNHAASIIPLSRHFLGRIRALKLSRSDKRATLKIPQAVIDDLELWLKFLDRAHTGISLNLLTIRKPSRICWSDACPYGIGGYLLSGRAWRFKIPAESRIYGDKRFNNLFEFIGMAVNVWLECQYGEDPSQVSILALGDNTSAIGWLFNTSKLSTSEKGYDAHLLVARKVASLVMEANCCLSSQHLKGDLNDVADLLSYWGNVRGKPNPVAYDDPPDHILTQRFHSLYHEQIPQSFAVSPLPNEISSWIKQVLQIAASSLIPDKKQVTRNMTERSDVGEDFVHKPDFDKTSSSALSTKTNESWSSEPSSIVVAKTIGPPKENLRANVSARWSQALCARPQATWQRRLGSISNQAPCTSRAAPTCIQPLSHSSERSTTPTPLLTDKKPSLPISCVGCSQCVAKNSLATTLSQQ